MAVLGNIQINALPDSAPLAGTEYLVVKQGTTDTKATLQDVLDVHAALKTNPHQVTKDQVGLGNVENDLQLKRALNLSDILDKPAARNNLEVYSKAESDANLKVHTDKTDNPHKVTAAQVGLGNVPNKNGSDSFRVLTDTLATTKAVNDLFKAIQNETPPGSILHTFDSRNPGTYKLCGGTWKLIAKGRTLVGFDDTNPTVRPLATEFGSANKTIQTANLPAHRHGVNINSQPHTHGVVGQTQGGGNHGHSLSGSAAAVDLGVKSGRVDDDGYHGHGGAVLGGGNHRHTYAGDDQLHIIAEVAQNQIGRYDADSDTDQWARSYWTSWSGDHVHGLRIDAGGTHGHNFRLALGAHGHSITGSANAVGDHVHGINFTSQAATVSVVGETQDTGSAAPFNVEQPSLVCYIWQRES